MHRNTWELAQKEFDLVIVGGGIFGICAAWDASQRGLSVALLERGDFAAATSANCFKMIHGGIRYLQHGDIARVRESARERSALLKVAPHLAAPLPIVVPTHGATTQGKAFLRAGVLAYDMITFDRNKGIPDPQRRVPGGHSLSTEDCMQMFPGLDEESISGGVLFYDGQMHSPQRLALSFLHSAVNAGAVAANYAEATGFIRNGDDITGVRVTDTITGDEFDVRGKLVLNAAGAWAEQLLAKDMGVELDPPSVFSRDAALVINRKLIDGNAALAVQGATSDPDAKVSRGNRHLFMVPWRDHTLVGVWHIVHKGHPDSVELTTREIQGFLDEFNDGYKLDKPLTLDDVSMTNFGLTLFGDNEDGAVNLSYGKRSRLVDHAQTHGVNNLLTMVGVRYTMARGVSQEAIDLAYAKLGRKAPECKTATTRVYGGEISDFGDFESKAIQAHLGDISINSMRCIVRNYGMQHKVVTAFGTANPSLFETMGDSNVIRAEVVHAVRNEMAVKLSDVVFQRTELGTGGNPGEAALVDCADVMAFECGWDSARTNKELDEVRAAFPEHSMVSV